MARFLAGAISGIILGLAASAYAANNCDLRDGVGWYVKITNQYELEGSYACTTIEISSLNEYVKCYVPRAAEPR
jgi:hypothetical protein